MIGSSACGILDTEVINYQGEDSTVCGMGEEACCLCLKVSVSSEVLYESLLGEKACLRKAVHSFGYLEKSGAIGDEWCKAVTIDDSRWEKTHGDAHVLRTQEGRSQVVILDVKCHPTCIV